LAGRRFQPAHSCSCVVCAWRAVGFSLLTPAAVWCILGTASFLDARHAPKTRCLGSSRAGTPHVGTDDWMVLQCGSDFLFSLWTLLEHSCAICSFDAQSQLLETVFYSHATGAVLPSHRQDEICCHSSGSVFLPQPPVQQNEMPSAQQAPGPAARPTTTGTALPPIPTAVIGALLACKFPLSLHTHKNRQRRFGILSPEAPVLALMCQSCLLDPMLCACVSQHSKQSCSHRLHRAHMECVQLSVTVSRSTPSASLTDNTLAPAFSTTHDSS
jgi:hypothetical protein